MRVAAYALCLTALLFVLPQAHAGYALVNSFAPHGTGTHFVSVAVDGGVYVATDDDFEDRTVQIFDSNGGYVGNILQAEAPNSVAVDAFSGAVYLSDGLGGYIWSNSGFTMPQPLGGVMSLATDVFGNVWAGHSDSVYQYAPEGALLNQFVVPGISSIPGIGLTGRATGIAVEAAGDLVYVAVAGTDGDRISVFFNDGTYLGDFGTHGSGDGQLQIGNTFCGALAIDAFNRLYVADVGNQRVQIFDGLTGAYISQFAVPGLPVALAVDPTGDNVWVVDWENNLIRQFALVPEPGSVLLFAFAVGALLWSGYRR